jgi:hypothetical protein
MLPAAIEFALEIVMALPNESCPRCGMERDEWPNAAGVQKDGQTYCCNGCANNTGCMCPQDAGPGAKGTSGVGEAGKTPAPM